MLSGNLNRTEHWETLWRGRAGPTEVGVSMMKLAEALETEVDGRPHIQSRSIGRLAMLDL